jgi:hypothetical protein
MTEEEFWIRTVAALEAIARREIHIPLPGGQGVVSMFGGDIMHGANETGQNLGMMTRATIDASGVANATYVGVTQTDPPVVVTIKGLRGAYPGALQVVKDESGGAGANPITIDDEDGRLFDGSPTALIDTNRGAVTYISDGTNWHRIGAFGG